MPLFSPYKTPEDSDKIRTTKAAWLCGKGWQSRGCPACLALFHHLVLTRLDQVTPEVSQLLQRSENQRETIPKLTAELTSDRLHVFLLFLSMLCGLVFAYTYVYHILKQTN